jgi:DNA-binding transcriptional regulator YiaG
MTPQELKAARTELGLSAQAFARLIGVHDGRTVRRWEHGEAPIPGLLPLYLHMRVVLAKIVETGGNAMSAAEQDAAKKVLELPKSGLTPHEGNSGL